jgi:hypothetical protein
MKKETKEEVKKPVEKSLAQ